MATYLPSSGAISINDINTLFARGNNLNAYRGTTYYTSTAGPFTFSAGAISMNGFYGTGPTANVVNLSYTFATSTANASLNVTSISGYVAGASNITITVNSGVYLYAAYGTSTAGLTLTGGTTGDTITLVNNGYIMGWGGTGGQGRYTTATTGTNAISLGYNTTINNTNASAYIGGGGGGGGGGRNGGSCFCCWFCAGGGGGAGGGQGANSYRCCCRTVTPGAGGSGGGTGAAGGNGTCGNGYVWGAGGGGRIFPGTGGARKAGGGAGGGGGELNGLGLTAVGGAGGAAAAAGSTGSAGNASAGGGGGGWGASGASGVAQAGNNPYTTAGAAGGKAVALNGKTVTWVSGNTTRVYGSVS